MTTTAPHHRARLLARITRPPSTSMRIITQLVSAHLRGLDGLSQNQIAAGCGCRVGTVAEHVADLLRAEIFTRDPGSPLLRLTCRDPALLAQWAAKWGSTWAAHPYSDDPAARPARRPAPDLEVYLLHNGPSSARMVRKDLPEVDPYMASPSTFTTARNPATDEVWIKLVGQLFAWELEALEATPVPRPARPAGPQVLRTFAARVAKAFAPPGNEEVVDRPLTAADLEDLAGMVEEGANPSRLHQRLYQAIGLNEARANGDRLEVLVGPEHNRCWVEVDAEVFALVVAVLGA